MITVFFYLILMPSYLVNNIFVTFPLETLCLIIISRDCLLQSNFLLDLSKLLRSDFNSCSKRYIFPISSFIWILLASSLSTLFTSRSSSLMLLGLLREGAARGMGSTNSELFRDWIESSSKIGLGMFLLRRLTLRKLTELDFLSQFSHPMEGILRFAVLVRFSPDKILWNDNHLNFKKKN